ncbi:unnamed protein product [Symbiodinium sp. CCMP2592]|nr:unnamed protein product [Symbiodinium sp. CCMP2592]
MTALANGTVKEKAELLRRFVACGENVKACESQIQMSKKQTLEGRTSMRLIAVKDMQKIDCIVSRGGGVPDRDAPSVLEETKFWCVVEESRTDVSSIGYEEQMTVHTRPTASTASRIMDGVVEPGLLNKRAVPAASPLSSDVLRAYDNYTDKLAQATGTTEPASDLL